MLLPKTFFLVTLWYLCLSNGYCTPTFSSLHLLANACAAYLEIGPLSFVEYSTAPLTRRITIPLSLSVVLEPFRSLQLSLEKDDKELSTVEEAIYG